MEKDLSVKPFPLPHQSDNGKKEEDPQPPKRGGEKNGAVWSAPEFLDSLQCPSARKGILRGFF